MKHPHNTTAFEIGAQIDGRYRVEKEIGRGATGVLYKAFDAALERPCALKVLESDDAVVYERLRREAAALAAVRDRHVPDVYAFGTHARRPYFAMEFIEGHTLGRIIAQHAAHGGEFVPLDRSLQILREVCAAMAEIHRVGVVHRDIKPDNVVLEDRTARTVLVDFGCAVVRDHWDGLISGTPKYLSPEAIHGRKPSVANDLYSFGCLAFHLWTNRVPYEARTFDELMLAHATDPIPRLSAIRPELALFEPILESLLAKDPSARPTNAAIVRNALDELQSQVFAHDRRRAHRTASGETTALGRSEHGIRVLVVDDEPSFARLAARCALIAHADVPVAVSRAESVAQAIASIQRKMPNLVVLDYLLPDGNGLELLSQLRAMPGSEQVAVLVVSQYVTQHEQWRFDSLGVSEFLDKPVDFTALVAAIQRVSSARGWTFDSPQREVG